MCAKWQKESKHSEAIALLEGARNPAENVFRQIVEGYNTSFDHDAFVIAKSILLTNLVFKEDIPRAEQAGLLHQTIFSVGEKGEITEKKLIKELTKQEGAYIERPLQCLSLLSRLSMKWPERRRKISVQGVQVHLTPTIPSRYREARKAALRKARFSPASKEPEDYLWVRASVNARSHQDAMSRGLNAIDILRSLWNLQLNNRGFSHPFMKMQHFESPLNRIVLGPFHTIHLPCGALASEQWFETPLLDTGKVYDAEKHWKAHLSYYRSATALRKSNGLHELLRDGLLGYCDALDNTAKGQAFLELWSVLEVLTCTEDANYSKLVKRASRLFSDSTLAKQVLEHLRLRRNDAVHGGAFLADTDELVSQGNRFCQKLLRILLSGESGCRTREEFKKFLDAPSSVEELDDRIRILKEAKKYRLKIRK